MLFYRVQQNNQILSSLSSNLQPWFKVSFVVFYRKFTKLATGVSFFVLVANAVATVGQGVPYPPLTTACAPPFRFAQNAFLEHHVTTRQQAIMGKGIIIWNINLIRSLLDCLQN